MAEENELLDANSPIEISLTESISEAERKFNNVGSSNNISEEIIVMKKTPEEIVRLFNTKEADNDWSFVEYKPSDTGKWTHDYHRYPAKFIPQLVEKLIDYFAERR